MKKKTIARPISGVVSVRLKPVYFCAWNLFVCFQDGDRIATKQREKAKDATAKA